MTHLKSFFILWACFVILLTHAMSASKETEMKQKLKDLLNYNVERQLFPKTLRFISFSPFKSQTEMELLSNNQIPLIYGDNKPLLVSPDPRVISTGRMTGLQEMFTYITLAFVNEPECVQATIRSLETKFNRRWDRLILVSEKTKILQQVLYLKITLGLKEKYGVDFETGEISTDPIIYNGGNLIKIKSFLEIPKRKKMGDNLHGRHLKIGTTEFPPMSYKTVHPNGSYSIHGSMVNIVPITSKIFNYTYEFSYNRIYGQSFPNGSWIGMYSQVFYPERDYAFAIINSYEFIWYYGADFITTIDDINIMFATNLPRTSLEWYAFLLPFTSPVWIYTILTYIILGIVQFIVMYYVHNKKLKYIVWDSAVFLPYAMAMEQGLMDIPKGARYLSLVWLMGCLVLGTGYKSTLRKNLSFPIPETLPKTFEELGERVAKREYDITIYKSGSIEEDLFKKHPLPRMKFVGNLDTCLRDVYRSEHTACVGWSSLLFHQTARSLTMNLRAPPLVFSKSSPKVNVLSMAFQRDSIYADGYSGISEGVFESGLILKWNGDEYYKAKLEGIERLNKEKGSQIYKLAVKQTKSSDTERSPLTLFNLRAIFFILPVGFVMSAILFGIEYEILNHLVKRFWVMRKKLARKRACCKRNKTKGRQPPKPISKKNETSVIQLTMARHTYSTTW